MRDKAEIVIIIILVCLFIGMYQNIITETQGYANESINQTTMPLIHTVFYDHSDVIILGGFMFFLAVMFRK